MSVVTGSAYVGPCFFICTPILHSWYNTAMKYDLNLEQMLKVTSSKVENVAKSVFEALEPYLEKIDKEAADVPVRRATIEFEAYEKGVKFPNEPKIDNDRTFAIIATTPHMDRDREVVLSSGIDLREWQKSGAILDSHDYNKLPIGKAVWVGKSDQGIKMHIEAAPTEAGNELLALSKFMPLTASIGFIPVETVDKNAAQFPSEMRRLTEKFSFLGKVRDAVQRIITRSVMLETSIVSVPANPNAVMSKAAKAHDEGVLDESEMEMLRKAYEPEPDTDEPVKEKDSSISYNVSPEMLEGIGYKFENGSLVKVEKEADPEPEPKPLEVKVLKKAPIKVKVLSTPEDQARKAAEAVELAVHLKRGGV